MLKVHRNSKGFTLIELLIVIAIIGILAAIAIPAYTGYTRKARVQEVISAMGAVKTACMAYYTEAGAGILLSNASTPALINTILGVDVPVKYLTSMVVVETAAAGSVITATLNNVIGGDTSGATIILDSGVDYKRWQWLPTSTLPATYLPKN
jgi:type IV pilus assembly protein PilA